MPFTDEQKKKIGEALSLKRGPAALQLACPICGTQKWTIADDMVRSTLQPQPTQVTLGGPSLPMIAIICSNCGNTQFLNVFVLGVDEIIGIKPGVPAKVPEGGEGNG